MSRCPNTQNRLKILRHFIDQWLEVSNVNRNVIAIEIVEQCHRSGLSPELQAVGIEFKDTGDLSKDQRTYSQKLFRWLGDFVEHAPTPKHLFFVEQAIVTAMPADIRVAYLNEVYKESGLCIGLRQSEDAAPERLAATMTKENAEAQIAVMNLSRDATEAELNNALRELSESAATTQAAIAALMKKKEAKQRQG